MGGTEGDRTDHQRKKGVKEILIDLTGYYKLYALKKQIRIIYTVVEKKVMLEVISIGKREEFAAYKDAYQKTK